jgi:hypothetical protein
MSARAYIVSLENGEQDLEDSGLKRFLRRD